MAIEHRKDPKLQTRLKTDMHTSRPTILEQNIPDQLIHRGINMNCYAACFLI